MDTPTFYYVYILQSEKSPNRFFYSGFTEALEQRRIDHNNGCCDYTRPFRPCWMIPTRL